MCTQNMNNGMRIIVAIILSLLLFSSCELKKSVTVTTRGYEPYRTKYNLSNDQIKGLQRSGAFYQDSVSVELK